MSVISKEDANEDKTSTCQLIEINRRWKVKASSEEHQREEEKGS